MLYGTGLYSLVVIRYIPLVVVLFSGGVNFYVDEVLKRVWMVAVVYGMKPMVEDTELNPLLLADVAIYESFKLLLVCNSLPSVA